MSTSADEEDLAGHLRRLRRSGDRERARALLTDLVAARPSDSTLRSLAWQHDERWWRPLRGRRLTLRRRGPDDAALVRACWGDPAFMRKFNRMVAPLPADDEALRGVLAREHVSVLGESHALHWTVAHDERKLGFVSVVNISLGHRRAEFLIGIRGGGAWDGPEASHLVLDFLANEAGLHRLTAYFYPDNQPAIDAAVKLGFAVEGVLRSYVRLADGTTSDLVVAGLVLNPSFFRASERMRRRLLRDIAAEGRDPRPKQDAASVATPWNEPAFLRLPDFQG